MKTRRCVYCKRRRPLKAMTLTIGLEEEVVNWWCRNLNTCGFAYWAEVARDMRRSIGRASRKWMGMEFPSRFECRRTIESITESRIRKETP